MRRLILGGVKNLNFGRHVGRDFDGLDAPFVVVHGANESGKSTLAEFLVWAIGGPWRTYAKGSDAYRLASGDGVHGRVLATLDGAPVDLHAEFKILNKGEPNDLRRGVIGGREMDKASIATSFGGLNPADYQLVYRLYGGSLGDIGSGVEFSQLFTSFAMGSATAKVNPRQSLEVLRQRIKNVDSNISKLVKSRKEIEKQIKEAQRAPEEIARREGDLAAVASQIEALSAERDELAAEIARVRKAHSGLVHLGARDKVLAGLEALGDLDARWRTVAENVLAIEEATTALRSATDAAAHAGEAAASAVAKCGMQEGDLRGRTLTPPERQQVHSVAGDLQAARATHERARNTVAGIEEKLDETSRDVHRRQEALSLSDSEIAHLDGIADNLASVSDRVNRWREATNELIALEGRLAGERSRLETLQGAPRVESAAERKALVGTPWLAAGALAAAVAAFWQPAVSAVVALVVAGLLFVGRGGAARGGDAVSTDAQVIRASIHRLEGDRAEAVEKKDNHRRLINDVVGPLGRLFDHPDLAAAQVESLARLAATRAQMVRLTIDLATARRDVETASAAVLEAEKAAELVLSERNVPVSLVNDKFGDWLALYEEAVGAVARSAAATEALLGAREKWTGLVQPVSGEIEGLEATAVLMRIRDAADLLGKIRGAEESLRDANVAVSTAGMDTPEVVELLRQFPSEVDLGSRLAVLEERQREVNARRDEQIARQSDLGKELDAMSGREVLPGLNLQLGGIDEELEEHKRNKTVLEVAESVLSGTIDGYEQQNQDPVVKHASELISQVDPDWGTVLFSRNDKGDPVIERTNASTRLQDRFISDGGRALLYLALRLAFAERDAANRNLALPLICDDPLIHFDDSRSQAAIGLMSRFSSRHQVVMFTCETSTRDMAAAAGARIIEI